MKDTGMTTMEVKKFNKNKVYNFIYNQGTTYKLMITKELQMGLSTVNQNLKLLEEEGFIQKNGYYDSTGGRKADAIEIIRTARISIGVAILQHMVDIVATDLYGEVLCSVTESFSYKHCQAYYKQVGDAISKFIDTNLLEASHILGVAIATQGTVSRDRTSVYYGAILGNEDMKLSDFQAHIPYPCRLEHDSKAAAYLELWKRPEIKDGILLLLNRNLGGAVISDYKVQNGTHMRSGSIEHICMDPKGEQCYCGKRGCLETYCSANALAHKAQINIPEFFELLHEGHQLYSTIWEQYLNNLALAISNLNIIVDGQFIISGYLAPYVREADLEKLITLVNQYAPFPIEKQDILVGTTGQFAQAIGASLYYTKHFITHI